MSESRDEDRPFTVARDPGAEERARTACAALASAAREAADGAFGGAALGGALGLGEGATVLREDGAATAAETFELVAVVDVPLREVPGLERVLRKAVETTARSRHVAATVRAVARRELPILPPTLDNAALVAAGHVVDGPADLLAAAPAFDLSALSALEGLRLLVRRGAALLAAERSVDRGAGRQTGRSALLAVHAVDLALGAAVLLSAGRWEPSAIGRERTLRSLLAGAPEGGPAPRPGFRARMSWTRFRELVERHRGAVEALARADAFESPDASRQVARASDRWMEVLRLHEEERLGHGLPSWTDHVRALAARHGKSATAPLFGGPEDVVAALPGLPSRRAVKGWPAAERLAPAIAALLDWDPGDLPVAPILLDLPSDSARDALYQRAIHQGSEA